MQIHSCERSLMFCYRWAHHSRLNGLGGISGYRWKKKKKKKSLFPSGLMDLANEGRRSQKNSIVRSLLFDKRRKSNNGPGINEGPLLRIGQKGPFSRKFFQGVSHRTDVGMICRFFGPLMDMDCTKRGTVGDLYNNFPGTIPPSSDLLRLFQI